MMMLLSLIPVFPPTDEGDTFPTEGRIRFSLLLCSFGPTAPPPLAILPIFSATGEVAAALGIISFALLLLLLLLMDDETLQEDDAVGDEVMRSDHVSPLGFWLLL